MYIFTFPYGANECPPLLQYSMTTPHFVMPIVYRLCNTLRPNYYKSISTVTINTDIYLLTKATSKMRAYFSCFVFGFISFYYYKLLPQHLIKY